MIPDNPYYTDNLVSLQYWDEQTLTTDYVDRATAKFAEWRTLYPNALGHTNHYGFQISSTALQNFMEDAQPDMIMFDLYPAGDGSRFPTPNRLYMGLWYSEMQKYRTAGLAGIDRTGQKPIPYAQYLDLFRKDYTKPEPAESFVRLQQFASWAFGYTYVSGFVYNDLSYTGVTPVMFDAVGDSSPTPTFDNVAETNRQSRNLGPALVRLVSTGIFMKPGSGESGTGLSGLSSWTENAGGSGDYITAVTPITGLGGGNDSSYPDTLVGYFKPLLADNSQATFVDGLTFMIVNGSASDTAAASEQWYRLAFDFVGSGLDKLARLSRDTGQVENVPLTSTGGTTYSVDINLPGGTGDLFCFYSGDTLPTIPEPGMIVLLITGLLGLGGYTWWERK